MMKEFKLIAIRPLKNCNVKFLRILKEDVIYPFYNGYNFTLNQNEVVVISATEEVAPKKLYNLEFTSGNNIDVSISTIVGKNGSGKSCPIQYFN